ncbi:MAG: exodeoxyribonuclease VII large subunit [Spirochaetaceae bacterium 4572_7]|nr:MAG: exodeoxyribonuclease VII large subunit [Spirochaetaceae bacterium 4572_7]
MNLNSHLFTVTELNQVIKNVLESSFFEINIEGEISNFRPAASGHWYFSLKDRDSSISAVMFKNSSYSVGFKPKDGMKVKASGKLSLYSQRGTYQVICNSLTIFGEGDILMMLEERKRKLAALGLFDPSKKKPLPRFPESIGIITSPTGAALQDILKVLKRRHSLSNIIILPSLVQGKDAGISIGKQIDKANRDSLCDLLIVSRGGGSIEDLLPFSEESIVYAINNSTIPIISGVGHEIDTNLCDLAADVRAATPSAAAEIATDASEKLYLNISNIKSDMINNMTTKITYVKSKLFVFNKEQVRQNFDSITTNYALHIDNLKRELSSNTIRVLTKETSRIKLAKKSIETLSPYALFKRGYSWVTKDNKSLIGQKLEAGDYLNIKYLDGDIVTEIKEIK